MIDRFALSFWQPYAWLITHGHATVDSRLWAPTDKPIGTTIAVHAAKRKMTKADFQEFLQTVKDCRIKTHPMTREEFDYGALVGTVKIKDVVTNANSYFAVPGYYHWRLESPRTIVPITTSGKRGWFRVKI